MRTQRLAVCLVVLLGTVAALSGGVVDAAGRVRPPALVTGYREALRAWFPAASVDALDAVDLSDAMRARPEAIGFAVADHAVRRFAPLALEASAKPVQAERLRRLGQIHDVASAQAARGSLALSMDAVERSLMMRQSPRLTAARNAVRAAERSLLYAMALGDTCAPPRARARRAVVPPTDGCAANVKDAMDEASRAASAGLAAGVEPAVLVEACLQSLRDL